VTIVDSSRFFAAVLTGLSLVACVPAAKQAPPPHPVIPVVEVPPPTLASTPSIVPRPQPSADLLNAIQALGGAFKGKAAISVRDVDEGWTISFAGDAMMPQQSVSKLWVAIAVMDAVDRGTLSLADPVVVRRRDLTLFHQPIRALVDGDGHETTIGKLLELAMTRSDNTCNDVLLWKVGGPSAIRRMLAKKGIDGVGFGPGERELQAKTAGLKWRAEWAGGEGFLAARAALPYETRRQALERYLSDPYDGASADGITLGLAKLERGELLSRASTSHLLGLMRASRTGALRLRSGIARGWTLAHKTGTGQDLASLSTGYNDVGIVGSPDGHRYAVAVMIASTREPIPVRMRLMGDVSRAIVKAHEARR
jgi:beta-lactamase class A